MMMCCLGILLFTINAVEAGPIKMKVYGKGGIVQSPDGYTRVCPYQSQETCADVTIQECAGSDYLNGAKATLNYNGHNYQIEIVRVEIIYIDSDTYYGQGLVVKGNLE